MLKHIEDESFLEGLPHRAAMDGLPVAPGVVSV